MPIPTAQGYIVPPNPTPTSWSARVFCLPDDGQWIATVMAALYELTYEENWDISDINDNPADVEAAVATANKIVLGLAFENNAECETVLTCEQIIDCIENDAETRAALEAYLSESGYGAGGTGGTAISPDSSTLNLIPDTATCTLDNIFGMCMELVEEIHASTNEVIEQINSTTRYATLFSQLLDNVPLIEVFGLFTEYIGWVKDSAYAQYTSAWSITVQQEIACELFCIAKDGCLLTMEDVWEVYRTLSNVPTPGITDFGGWAEEIMNHAFGFDLEVVAQVDMIGLVAMRYGGKFAEYASGIRDLATTMELAANASDPDHTILCDCPPVGWCVEYDFTVVNNFEIGEFDDTWLGGARPANGQPPAGVAASGIDAVDYTQFNGSAVRALMIFKNWSSSVTITDVKVYGDFTNGSQSQTQSLWSLEAPNDYGEQLQARTGAGTIEGTDVLMLQWSGSLSVEGLWLWLRADSGAPHTGLAKARKIVIEGTGANMPDDATPCP